MQGQITLRPEQADILDRGLMWAGPPLVWSSPTGSGKTWLARFALRKALDQGLRAVILVPLRAIATEVATQLRTDPLFADAKIARLTGELACDGGVLIGSGAGCANGGRAGELPKAPAAGR